MKLHRSKKIRENYKKLLNNPFARIVILVLVVVIALLIGFFYNNRTITVSSAQYGFSMKFPGKPSISKNTQKIDGKSLTEVSYIYYVNSDDVNGYGLVIGPPSAGAIKSPIVNDTTLKNLVSNSVALLNDIKKIKKSSTIQGASLVNSKITTFEGLKAIFANIQIKGQDGGKATYYFEFFIKKDNVFLVETFGLSQNKFDKFLASLTTN